MKFTETELRGAFVIDIEPIADDRGFFTYLWLRRAGGGARDRARASRR